MQPSAHFQLPGTVYNLPGAKVQPSRRDKCHQPFPKNIKICSVNVRSLISHLMPDGTPKVTPVWVDLEGDRVVFNSAKGRQKDKNVRRDPHVALAIVDPDNPYRYLEIRGRVVEITEEGADDHIDKLAKKYLGVDKYPYRQASETRVIYKIQPDHTTMMG